MILGDRLSTQKRNVVAIVQTRGLTQAKKYIETQLRKFDRTCLEVMPGIWHLVTGADIDRIRSGIIGAVPDREDDRVLVLENPDGFAAWVTSFSPNLLGKC